MDEDAKARRIEQLRSMIEAVPESSGTAWGHDDGPDDGAGENPAVRKCYERIVMLCSYHEFCQSKMRDRLVREKFSPGVIDKALSKAVGIGLIDDRRWGEMRASGLMRKGMGIPGVERELRACDIEPSRIVGWPHDYSERFGSEHDRAMELIRRNPPRSKNPRSSAYSRLMRKGYAPSVAAQVSSQWDSMR